MIFIVVTYHDHILNIVIFKSTLTQTRVCFEIRV